MTRESQGNLAVYWERNRVQLVKNGQLVFDSPWEEVKELVRLLSSATIKAQEWAEAHNMIQVQATLIKGGIPFSVVNNPEIYKEAQKEAQWGRRKRS